MSIDVARHVNVYCDESRHTSDPSDRYMVIGALACPRDHKREVVTRIHTLQRQHNAQGEFGWKRLSPNRQAFYWNLIELFRIDAELNFRCIVVDRNILDHQTYSDGDEELGFYKLYYQMLVHWLKPGATYHIYLDWQQNQAQHRFTDLRFQLRDKLSGRAKIDCLEPLSSHNQPLISFVDLFIGAVGYAWNERHGSQTKIEFCHRLADAVGLRTLTQSTGRDAEKFNIFHFQGR